MNLWEYIDYREAIASLGFPTEEDVRNEMAIDAFLEEMYQYFGDDLPEDWQGLPESKLLEKWREYKEKENDRMFNHN